MNNRQAGRRRGRGGQRQGGNPGRPDNGNRIDNRARGNAAQLLEKYKNLARDAQMSGDRVNTEYYLQFADHYFRVLSESRSRFEEQNQQRRSREEDGDGFDGDEDYGFEGEAVAADAYQPREERGEEERRPRREARGSGRARDEDGGRPREGDGNRSRDADGEARDEARPVAANDETRSEPRPRRGRPRREDRVEAVAAEPETFDIDRLPPALAPAEARPVDTAGEDDAAERPRRTRRRRATTNDDDEAVPPAA